MTENTLFQELVNNDEVVQMINDLQTLDWDEADGAEVAVKINQENVPRIIEELEELEERDSR